MDSGAYTVEETATRLGVSVRSVWRRIRAGELETVQASRPSGAGRGRTYVTAESVQRATAAVTQPEVMETDGTARHGMPVSESGTEPAGQVAQLTATVAALSGAVERLTVQLAAAEDERRALAAELAQLRAAPPTLALRAPVTMPAAPTPAPDALTQTLKKAGVKGKGKRRRLVEQLIGLIRTPTRS